MAEHLLTERDVAAFAAELMQRDEYKELLKRLKNNILRSWANEKDGDAREALWYRIQAVGELEAELLVLCDVKVMHERKEAAAKRAEAKRNPGG